MVLEHDYKKINFFPFIVNGSIKKLCYPEIILHANKCLENPTSLPSFQLKMMNMVLPLW